MTLKDLLLPLLVELENLNLSEARDLTQKAEEELGYDLTPFARSFLSRKGYNFCLSLHVWKELIPSNYQMIFDDLRAKIHHQATHVYAPRMPFKHMFQNPSVTHLMLNVNSLDSEDLARMFPNLKFLSVCFSACKLERSHLKNLKTCYQWDFCRDYWWEWVRDVNEEIESPRTRDCVPTRIEGVNVPQALCSNGSILPMPYVLPAWIPTD